MAASMVFSILFAAVYFSCFSNILAIHEDEFNEELLLKPLSTGHLYGHFQFTTTWNVTLDDKSAFSHYHLFPKALGDVLARYHVQELHLSLTAGLWRYEKWGYPVTDAPPGAQLWVWFKEGTQDVDQVWTDLINVLSGIFCASLNFMDTKATVIPQFSFRPQGVTSDVYNRFGAKLVRYAALPRENVCTENLTPWKKLLPCGSKAGLATLLNAGNLYDTSYHSIGVHFRPVCQNADCSQTGVELGQSVGVVFEPVVANKGKQDWTMRKIFGRNLATSCPLATNSKIYIDITSNKTMVYYFTLSPQPQETVTVRRGDQRVRYAVYDVPVFTLSEHVLNLGVKYNKHMDYSHIPPPLLHAHRFQTGYGQEKGGVTCLLYNQHATSELPVLVMETLPWYLRTYLHTLGIERFSLQMKPGENGTKVIPVRQHFSPGRDRGNPYFLELVLRLPPQSVTRISLQFERALLTWTEYPPDANHGFYVNSAVISTVLPEVDDLPALPQGSSLLRGILNESVTTPFVRLHTETLLVTLPTPDFSMPYNVICLACTVVAIAFGSIHNLTTRRFVVLNPNAKPGLLTRIKGMFTRGKKQEEEEKKKEEEAKKQEENQSESEKESEEEEIVETRKSK